jgi:signal transduction histidine kinase
MRAGIITFMTAKLTLKILCLEDDIEDFEILNYTLERSGVAFTSRQVDTREKFIEALEQFHPDVILSDHSLPLFNSTDALALCREMKYQAPFILVTGAVSDEFAVNSMKQGADDYILKSNLNRLASAIETAIRHRETEKAKIRAVADLAARNDQLLKINQELDSLVYSVSHNLRAPLMSVLGLLNLAKDEANREALCKYYELMESSIKRLDDTVKEILDYSRNARQELSLERVDLRRLIDETLEKMKYMTNFDKLDIEISVKDKVVYNSDYYRLSVIINNIISNAIKYQDTSKSQSFLKIRVVVDASAAKFHFEDNGIGIDPQFLPKIFNMFFRATAKNEGSGLGLYIVKEAIEKLNGHIEIDSAPGKGTIFRMELPNHSV